MFAFGGGNRALDKSGGGNNNNSNDASSSIWPPKRSTKSFHAPTDLQRQRDNSSSNASSPNTPNNDNDNFGGSQDNAKEEESMTIQDLHETISHLKKSLLTHPTSSAETMEHFQTLQSAHDTLYGEHVHLQEQMDDPVELLKYLKAEKSTYETQIIELKSEIHALRESNEENVFSMTIEKLTKEKMELEKLVNDGKLKDEHVRKRMNELNCENSELLIKIDALEKVKAGYEEQIMNNNSTSEKEEATEEAATRVEVEELRNKVIKLEEESVRNSEQQTKHINEYKTKLQTALKELDNGKESFVTLQLERDTLLTEQTCLQDTINTMKRDMNKYRNQVDEMNDIKLQLDQSLEKIAQLQRRDKSSSSSSTSSSSKDLKDNAALLVMEEKLHQLESMNRTLLKEKEELQVYVQTMEGSLVNKDVMLETIEAEHIDERTTFNNQLSTLQSQIDTHVEDRTLLQNQLSTYQKKQEAFKVQLKNQQDEIQRYQREMMEKDANGTAVMLENDTLRGKVRELQDLLDGRHQGSSSSSNDGSLQQQQQYPAELEKEMQERLTKR